MYYPKPVGFGATLYLMPRIKYGYFASPTLIQRAIRPTARERSHCNRVWKGGD